MPANAPCRNSLPAVSPYQVPDAGQPILNHAAGAAFRLGFLLVRFLVMGRIVPQQHNAGLSKLLATY